MDSLHKQDIKHIFDSIMKPPYYEITPPILKLISSIAEKVGEIKASHLIIPQAD
ncbi:hypothetical protein [Algoriphagus sediminis]|uniref:Uncharacterized protein n=1 Tax=Algoriphagus sediminis TaxID=3057113 RepID=A0ABT7YDK7_9BACT|nr:hypothetical protein [Algoriphagus sediminis]MDN3204582.1 hypothetical protein [Algoriphagus sediminis]